MPPRFFVDFPIAAAAATFALPAGAARHVQVLRLQPGEPLVLFDGLGGQWQALVQQMGKRDVTVVRGAHDPTERELVGSVTLAVGMPANERFDWLVEKATELGVAQIQPLMCERSVVRLHGERALRKRDHWQGIAVAAAEQSGRTRVPHVALPVGLAEWLDPLPTDGRARVMLSPSATQPWRPQVKTSSPFGHLVLSGPEGGLTHKEEERARSAGFAEVHLGPRILRAETAPLVALALIES